ncbi:potassium-transporting ATPase subunit KdpA [Nocardia sp. NPDC101769]|uniref:potassium-transporting ATPase subunit KdpA n=1 Tax=Nocardia sp. NPDC101769 TaxID=3364333 RepID=UPI00381270F1
MQEVGRAGHCFCGLAVGSYLAKIYGGGNAPGDKVFGPVGVERLLYRCLRIDPGGEQRWIAYVGSALAVTVVGALGNYALFRAPRS